ncbi:hypothetical protein Tco_0104509 [Tanacetum coccineum]
MPMASSGSSDITKSSEGRSGATTRISEKLVCRRTCQNDLKYLVKTYRIPLELHPRLPDHGFTMDRLPADAIGIYSEFLWGLVSFSKRRNTEDVCMDDGPSSLKKWKDNFFLIDRRAVTDYLTWRHSCSCVSDDLPSDGYDRNDVQRLRARLIHLREMRDEVLVHSGLKMSIYDFMTLSSWCDAKIVEESHHVSLLLLERVPLHTIMPVAEGAMVPLPTLDEIAASLPDPRLSKKSKGPVQARVQLGQAKGMDDVNLTDFCAEIEDSLEKDEGASTRAALALISRMGKRLGAPPSMAIVSASEPSHVETSARASIFGHSLSLGGAAVSGHVGKSGAEVLRCQVDPLDFLARSALARDVEYDQIPEDDFGIATRGEEINLTLFPLALGPYHMPYLYEDDPDVCTKALDRTITHAELKRTESLLLLELSNHVNVLSALLVSHGYELNSRYTNLVSSSVHLQEKLDKKKGMLSCFENRELRSQRDAASEEIRKMWSQLTDAKTTSASLSEELTQTDANLSEQALTVRDLQNELVLENDEFYTALACVASLGINYGVERGLRMGRTDVEFEAAAQKVYNFHVGAKDDFDKALDDFPTTPFPFLSKIVAASEGMTASVPYARLNGVSSLLILGVVLWAHNTFGNSSTHAPPSWCNLVLIPCIMLRFARSTASFACE